MSTVNNGPQIVRNGLVLDLDASSVTSYSAIAVYSVQCYSTYNGGLRSANYTVQYSDDNSTWTTAFTGVMSNDSSCGIITGTNRNDSNYTKHRYWRYVEGGAVVGHHPRVSRIDFITKSGAIYNLTTYTTDNCADSGTYIVGTVTKDFGTTTWRDTSGNGYLSTLTNGPVFDNSNKGNIVFDGSNDFSTYTPTPTILQGNPNLTVMGFYKRTASFSNKGFWGIGGSNAGSTGQGICNWNQNNTNEITIDSWSQSTFTTGQTYPLNTWIGVAWRKIAGPMTRANCTISIFNGTSITNYTSTSLTVLRSEAATDLVINSIGGITLGSISVDTGYCSPVNIANHCIYNRILTDAEISQNFQATKTRFGL
jgi:hypothetical protein